MLAPAVIPRLAWHSRHFLPGECPPLLLLFGVFTAGRRWSRRGSRFSDEPFRVRDIQFNCPTVLVEACPTREEIADIGGTRRFAGPNRPPAIVPAGPDH